MATSDLNEFIPNPAAPDRATVSAICRLLEEQVGSYTIGENYAAIGDWMWQFWTPIQDMEPERARLWEKAVVAALSDGS